MNENLFRWSKTLRSPLCLGCCGCNSYGQAGRTAKYAVALSFHSIHGQKVPKKAGRQKLTDRYGSVFSLSSWCKVLPDFAFLCTHTHVHGHTQVARARRKFSDDHRGKLPFSAGRCGCPFASRGFFLGRVGWSILIHTSDTIFYSVGHNSSG
uniref:(northern house mosquito) hypothetical protein n=1 Tax=Culex pipiens TaxID=7175 RepID=A0A8D8MJZ3_CULPI